MKIFKYILLSILFNACISSKDEILQQIPIEFQGVWVYEQEKEYFLVIKSDSIYQYSIIENYTDDTTIHYGDTLIKEIIEINKVERRSCSDCTYYGINIKIKDDMYTHMYLYLNKYDHDSNKYMRLEEHDQINNPYNDSRVWRGEEIWERVK